MGTKRPFDEDFQEFFKHPKHLVNENKPDSFGEDKYSFEASRNVEVAGEGVVNFFHVSDDHKEVNAVPDSDKIFETNASLPVLTGISGHEDISGPGLTFCSNLFPEFFEFNLPRRQVVHHDDTYASLLNCSPRKEIPVGPEHQAEVSEFDSDSGKNYTSDPDKESLLGICVIPNQEGEMVISQRDCKCLDDGSIRCVQQHVNEARLNLQESLGTEKFGNLGFNNIGEEAACNWTEEEEKLFQNIVYSNPVSHGKRFWEELSVAFQSRTKKELVSYYFNVFILRRRAVQNRSKLLAIDSDDDEWWGSKRGPTEVVIEDQDYHVVGPLVDHIDHEFQSEDGDHDDNVVTDGDIVIDLKDGQNQVNGCSLSNTHDAKATSGHKQEHHVNMHKEGHTGGLRSESYLHWDPPYSTMGSTKGVDLLPTCSMIEEIFGSSKTGKSS